MKPPHPVPSTTTRGADDVDVVVDDVSVAVVDVVAVVSLMVVFVVVDDDSVRTEVIRQDHDGALKLRMMNNERDMMTYVYKIIIYIGIVNELAGGPAKKSIGVGKSTICVLS